MDEDKKREEIEKNIKDLEEKDLEEEELIKEVDSSLEEGVEEESEVREFTEVDRDLEGESAYEELNDEIQTPSNKDQQAYNIPPAKLSKKNWFAIIAIVLIFSFAGGFGGVYVGNQLIGEENILSPSNEAVTINTNDSINTVSAVVKKNIKSVVGITTLATSQANIFSQPQDVSGVGSGVIVSSDGYILTNSHVIADGDAKELKVLFEDGETVDGKIVWVDPLIDLAVVKVEKNNLTVAELGDSDELIVGEIAIAIGNPLGLEFERTVTSGIISGLNRTVRIDQSNVIDFLIQTDASINPGNSGGPLLNSQGKVIGINTAKVKTGEGLGFAIPINQVKEVVAEIIETGNFQTVYMGITGVSVEEYQQRLGLKLAAEKGIVIIEVEENSAANKAGILSGDVIQSIDGNDVKDMGQLKRNLYKFKQNDTTSLVFLRNGAEQTTKITFSNVR